MWQLGKLSKFFLVAFALAAPAQVFAAPEDNPEWRVPGKWRPWSMVATGGPDNAKCASRSEWGAWEANLQRVRRIWEQIPAIATPIGYEISAGGAYPVLNTCMRMVRLKDHRRGERPTERVYDLSAPLAGSVSFNPFTYVAVKPKLEADHETLPVYFNVNSIPTSALPLLDDTFIEPIRTLDRFGLPAYYFHDHRCIYEGGDATCPRNDKFLIVRNSEAPLWVPVPLIDVYDQMLDRANYEVERLEVMAEQSRARWEDSLSEKERTSREKTCRDLALKQKKVSPEDYVVSCQKNSQRYEDQLRKDIAGLGPRSDNKWGGWIAAAAKIAELRQALLATNPSAAASICAGPYVDMTTQSEKIKVMEYAARFKAGPAPACRAVVKANGDYFNRKLPRSALQLVTVTDYDECLNLKRFDVPGRCVADLALLENMDWSALRKMMDK